MFVKENVLAKKRVETQGIEPVVILVKFIPSLEPKISKASGSLSGASFAVTNSIAMAVCETPNKSTSNPIPSKALKSKNLVLEF